MLSLQGLEFVWKEGAGVSPALRFADVEAEQGDQLLLRGPSGSGKSTLLALIAGLLTPRAGRVVVAGTDVGALPRGKRDAWRGRTLGFVPQRLHLSESLSVAQNLALPFVACGAVGHVSVASNLIPEIIVRLVDAALAGDLGEALALQKKYYPLMRGLMSLDVNPVPIKTAVALQGHCSAELRLPLAPLSEDSTAKLTSLLKSYQLL